MKHITVERDFLLADISQSDLKSLGLGDVAYVKRLLINGRTAYVLHAADGTALAVQTSVPAAERSAFDRDLGVVTLH